MAPDSSWIWGLVGFLLLLLLILTEEETNKRIRSHLGPDWGSLRTSFPGARCGYAKQREHVSAGGIPVHPFKLVWFSWATRLKKKKNSFWPHHHFLLIFKDTLWIKAKYTNLSAEVILCIQVRQRACTGTRHVKIYCVVKGWPCPPFQKHRVRTGRACMLLPAPHGTASKLLNAGFCRNSNTFRMKYKRAEFEVVEVYAKIKIEI